jgi:drug/metabolite transporter (DMT)-like permease
LPQARIILGQARARLVTSEGNNPNGATMSWSLLLGLSSGLCWGAADFVGGLQARRLPSLAVTLWSQLIGGLVLLSLLLLRGPVITAGAPWGVAAGLCGGLALVLFYRALAIGTMSLVAPVSACGAVVPVLVGVARGESLGPVTLLGMAAALAGIVFVSLQGGGAQAGRNQRPALLGALGAALGFGLFFTLIDRAASAPGASALWVNVWARAGSVPLLLALQLASVRAPGWPGRAVGMVGLVGVLDMSANVLFALATQAGSLGVVAVLGSLYPVTTVLLSWVLLAERLTRVQYLGVGLALLGVGLLAGG